MCCTSILFIFLLIRLYFSDGVRRKLSTRDSLELDQQDVSSQYMAWTDSLLRSQIKLSGTVAAVNDQFSMTTCYKGRTKNSQVQDIEKYHCLACNRKYLRKKSLTRHLRYECGKQPLYLCPVELCSYKAFYRVVLEKHIHTHMKK